MRSKQIHLVKFGYTVIQYKYHIKYMFLYDHHYRSVSTEYILKTLQKTEENKIRAK